MRKVKINIRDIARLANVSVATVSRVINGSPNVSEKTRKKVLKIIQEYDYHPSAFAQKLSKARTQIVALLIPYERGFILSDAFFPPLIKGMTEVFDKKEYNIMLSMIESPYIPQKYVSLYKRGIVDGYILANVKKDDPFPEVLYEENIPFVSVGRVSSKLKKYPYVDTDNVKGAFEATTYFLEKGHKRIALLKGNSNYNFIQDRYEGYILALKKYGIKPDPKLIVEDTLTIDGGYKAMKKLLKINNPPTAVLACSDYMAIGAMDAILEEKWEIPEDVAIIGFDDLYIDGKIEPPLASVRQEIEEMGKEAAKLFLHILDNPIDFEPIILPATFIWRRSAG
ncbi:MAG: LacI family DNA-binding transcriptional regulator [Dictyoglomus sp.]|uniref:LacI family DNA-binding transcriptional regulator n=1 Tax=Dictyoglomus sp. TaxID=28205 RepID=UPI003D0E00EB